MTNRKAIAIVKKILSYLYKDVTPEIKWKGKTLVEIPTGDESSFMVEVWDKNDRVPDPFTARVYLHEQGFYQVVVTNIGDYVAAKHHYYQVGLGVTYPSVYAGDRHDQCNVQIFSH